MNSGARLPRAVGLWSAVAVVIGSTIGSGIFRSPAAIADKVPAPLVLLAVWVVGGVVALSGALTLAEVTSHMPRTGGFYAILREGWGRPYAFLFGWSQLAIVRAASLGALALTFAEYALRLCGCDPAVAPHQASAHWLAAGAILATAAANILGVRWGTAVTNTTVVAKYGGLAFIVLLALAVGLPQTGGHFTPLVPQGSVHVGAFGLAVVSVLWAYDGWGDLSYLAGEVKDPERNLPRALLMGTGAVAAIYLLANIGYLAVLPIEQMRSSPLVAADVAQRILGSPGVLLVSLTVMVSTFGTLGTVLMTSPRVFFAMAGDGMLFRRLAAVHPRYQTPYLAIGLVAILGCAFVLLRSFEQLADAFVVAMLPFYSGAVAAIYRLRSRPGYTPKFRAVGYPVVPAIFLAGMGYLMVNALLAPASRAATLAVLGVVAAGLPVYWLTVGRKGRRVMM